ncbi:hypothetical protein AOQ84DRAFT_225155 [Glonium stellatum]|uniref:Uncharacterized protein n=1 Tax=Glonium stellatum TaxID=574774 RepID=A0A8E2JPR2_9PEZI|nr:hypothetical protein AOQ84DRAFT_225155 [Glonium stellatum]
MLARIALVCHAPASLAHAHAACATTCLPPPPRGLITPAQRRPWDEQLEQLEQLPATSYLPTLSERQSPIYTARSDARMVSPASTDIRAAAEPCLRGHPADMEIQPTGSSSPLAWQSTRWQPTGSGGDRPDSNQALLHMSGGLSGTSAYRETSPAAIACRAAPLTCCSYET